MKVSQKAKIHKAKSMYEVEGLSLTDIAADLSVSSQTMGRWKKKGEWLRKHEKKKELQKITRQLVYEAAAKRGMNIEKIVDELVKGIKNTEIETVVGKDAETGEIITDSKPDFKNRLPYIKELLDIIGAKDKPSENILGGISVGEGGVANIQVLLPPLKEDED